MGDLTEIKRKRFLYLSKLYDDSSGNPRAVFDMIEVGTELGYDYSLTRNVVDYLMNEGLIEAFGLGGTIQLTHSGVKEVEEAYENPTQPTEHFAPFVTYNNNITITSSGDGSIINTGNENVITLSNIFNKHEVTSKVNNIIECIKQDDTIPFDIKTQAIATFNELVAEVNNNKPSRHTLDKVMLYGASIASIGSLVVGILQLLAAKG